MEVPKSLQTPSHAYPPHNVMGLEEYCGKYLHLPNSKSDVIYLPVYWTNNYVRQQRENKTSGFHVIPEQQDFLSRLDSNKQYVTVVQCADGIYEDVPDNVHVFAAGGVGDTSIPLLCTPHEKPRVNLSREFLASFVGSIECGGPIKTEGKATKSSWDADGSGAKIRREMMQVFDHQPEFYVSGTSTPEEFRNRMLHSVFALAPRGYGKTSFRLYEAMELGCVPVYIYDDLWIPHNDTLDWSTFCVLCPASELSELPTMLRTFPEDWISQALSNIRGLLLSHFSLPGLVMQLRRTLEGQGKSLWK